MGAFSSFSDFRPIVVAVVSALLLDSQAVNSEDIAIDYSRDIRPIFVQHCYRCHSDIQQEGRLRLDSPDSIRSGGEGGPVVVPGDPVQSRLIQAIERQGELRMPPDGKPLSEPQIELLRKWVLLGANAEATDPAQSHWAFRRPNRPDLPPVMNKEWVRGSIDTFVAAAREERGLVPVGPAPKNILLRRLYLDLVGFPPAASEVIEILRDDLPDALDRIADQLLASNQYGVRWGRHWMDVWRYSDWDGYGTEVRESQPHIWRWRDWIVDSLNEDKPYDRMIVEMLAGDEIAPDDQRILPATGFLARNWYRFNRNVWLDATVEHTGKAFLAMTFNCARCHDHMYDPLQQREYYQLRAIFEPHEVRIDPLGGQADTTKDGLARVYDAHLSAETYKFVRGDEKQPDKDQALSAGIPRLFGALALPIQSVSLAAETYYPGSRPREQAEARLQAMRAREKAHAALEAAQIAQRDADEKLQQYLSQGPTLPIVSDEARELVHETFQSFSADRWTAGVGQWTASDGLLVQTDPRAEICGLTSVFIHPRDFVATLRYRITGGKTYKSAGLAFDIHSPKDWLSVYTSACVEGQKIQFMIRQAGQDQYPDGAALKSRVIEWNREYELRLVVRNQLLNVYLDNELQLAYRLPARVSDGRLMLWTYDAEAAFSEFGLSELPRDLPLFSSVGGDVAPVERDDEVKLRQAQHRAELVRSAAEREVAAAESSELAVNARIAADQANYSTPPAPDAKERSLHAARAERHAKLEQARWQLAQAELTAEVKVAEQQQANGGSDDKSKKALADAERGLTEARTAVETAQAATSATDDNYSRFGNVYPATSTGRRIAFARWIASKDNPLTARVAVNHIWLRHFGVPLVPTVFDFGLNGKRPSHPQLLDWLATELMNDNWQLKRLHRRLVSSSTYHMSSASSQENAANQANDRDNIYLWKMPSRRMEAEIVRDSTLQVSGQLWLAQSGPDLDPGSGLTLPRRSIYFRTSKEKKMTFLALFDSANVVDCYRRSESVAPQQALAQANSTLTLSQSRLLARDLPEDVLHGPAEPFVQHCFLQILGRAASPVEELECVQFLGRQAELLENTAALSRFVGSVESPVVAATEARIRARENLVHVLLNHHEFVTIR